jgi:hypothetical protein
MKTLAKLVMLLVVLALCLPAYGDILVYKVSIKVKGIDVDEDERGTLKARGYLVVEADFGFGDIYDSSLILYGKDDEGDKVQETFVDAIDYFIWLETSHGAILDIGGVGEAVLTGKAKPTNVGTDEKVDIAKKMTGNVLVDGVLPLVGFDALGSGTISARLHSKWTKDANEDGGIAFGVVVGIVELYLDDKGYLD